MNQRSKRARDRKNSQDIGASTFQTGGHVASHRRNADPVVRTPQKTTGDVPADKAQGLAKASPFFNKLKDILPGSKTDEKKAVAEATEKPVDKTETPVVEKETPVAKTQEPVAKVEKPTKASTKEVKDTKKDAK